MMNISVYMDDLMFDYGAIFSKGTVSAIVGAITGGGIAAFVQYMLLRESRRVRENDRKLTQQALARALLFKMIRVYSNSVLINRHIEECFLRAYERKLEGEPWTFVIPFGNLPERMHFTPDEMGMLLSLKDNDLFNLVINQDVCHNSLNDVVEKYNECRRKLTDQLTHDAVEGDKMSGSAARGEMLRLRPRIIEVNQLVAGIRGMSKRSVEEGKQSLLGVQRLFKEKLDIALKLDLGDGVNRHLL